jgi:hypothetical protein
MRHSILNVDNHIEKQSTENLRSIHVTERLPDNESVLSPMGPKIAFLDSKNVIIESTDQHI